MQVLFITFLLHWASPAPSLMFLPPLDPGTKVTQKYSKHHHGVDVAVSIGTPVVNGALGVVTIAVQSSRSQSGKHVVVRGLGRWSDFEWSYCHLSKVDVAVGQIVDAGEIIGRSGNTGHSTGPHLHFAVLHNGEWIKPDGLLH